MPTNLTEYRVTFGAQYAHEPHPRFLAAHPDGWVAVFASDELIARCAAVAVLGTAWSSIYHPEDDGYPHGDGYYPRGELGRLESTDPALTETFIHEAVKRAEAIIAEQSCGESRQGYMRQAVREALELLPDSAPWHGPAVQQILGHGAPEWLVYCPGCSAERSYTTTCYRPDVLRAGWPLTPHLRTGPGLTDSGLILDGSWIGHPTGLSAAPCPECGRPIHEPSCTPVHEALQAEAVADAMKLSGGGS